MPATPRSIPARMLQRVLPAAFALLAGACTTVGSRPGAQRNHGVDVALRSVQQAWTKLPDGQPVPEESFTEWRASLGGLLRALKQNNAPVTWTGTQSIEGWTVTFCADAGGRSAIPPAWCGEITPVNFAKSVPQVEAPVRGGGAGLPVVMRQRYSGGARDPFLPRKGRCLPATFTAEFTGARKVTLTFHHTRNVQAAKVRGVTRPLAYDLTSPIMQGMDRWFLGKYALSGLLRPENGLRYAGIYAPEIFDPQRIPLVLIHGFESDPHIWRNVMNSVAADPILRQRYQVWYFLYPTGLTIHGAAAALRHSLLAARDFYDPAHRSAAMNQTILVGHSMGGVISHMQVIDSGDDVYHAFFTVPPEKLPFSRDNRQQIMDTLFFKRLPFVKRVVYITTPHKGSDVAEFSIVRQLARLIQPTVLIRKLLKEMASAAQSAINPQLHRFRDLGGRSTDSLSPKHPLLPAINRRPVHVPFHSIIAVWAPLSRKKPVEQSTDGAVPFRSAWLPEAQSTRVIDGFHGCVETPAVAKEIMRILHLHAAGRY